MRRDLLLTTITGMSDHVADSAGDHEAARRATPADAPVVAHLLHDFNTEFDAASPGIEVLALRLRKLLASPTTFALLAGDPAVGVALVTLRTNVW